MSRAFAGGGPGRSPRQQHPHLLGSFEAAARSLSLAGHPLDGGWLLVAFVDADLRRTAELDPDSERLGGVAARLLEQGRARLAAARIAAAVGDRGLAIRWLDQAGAAEASRRLREWRSPRLPLSEVMPGLSATAARRASTDPGVVRAGARRALARLRESGRAEAAMVLASALGLVNEGSGTRGGEQDLSARAVALSTRGRVLEAARSWIVAGQPERALQDVLRVHAAHPEYRDACLLAIGLAVQAEAVSFELDHMLGPFIAVGPQAPQEIEAFKALSDLYARTGQRAAARDLLGAVLRVEPGRTDLRAAWVALGGARGLPAADASGSLPDLPALPSLPPIGLPPLTPPAPPPRVAGAAAAGHLGLAPSGGVPRAAATPVGLAGSGPAGETLSPWADRAAGTHQADHSNRAPPTLAPDFAGSGETLAPGGAAWSAAAPGAATQQGIDPNQPRAYEQPAQAVRPVPTPAPMGHSGAVFSEGSVIAGRYRIEVELGEGGMGTVYRAQDLELGEAVALKVLTIPARSEKLVERFRRELRLSRRLTHPNVVRVHDLGVFAGWRYITMELLRGADLERRLRGGPLPLSDVVGIIAQAAEGLALAHSHGVVHRDIKPANLFLTDDGVVKVMDFGLAANQGSVRMTQVGTIAGSPAYMSPEQGQSLANAGPAADLYSLGVVAYELLTGRVPFQSRELLTLLRQHAEDPVPPLCLSGVDIPAQVEAEVMRALSKAPEDRHDGCPAFAGALRAAAFSGAATMAPH